jgi:hypothetical protein
MRVVEDCAIDDRILRVALENGPVTVHFERDVSDQRRA